MHRLPPHPAVQTAVVGGVDPEFGIEIDPVAGAFDAPDELRVLVAGQLGVEATDGLEDLAAHQEIRSARRRHPEVVCDALGKGKREVVAAEGVSG